MRCHSIKDKENICKQCGKGFDSMRALFGHMRHHTKRSRLSNESPKESQSEYETACPIRRKRSKTRYKITGNFASSNLNSSSNVSEIDEVEEAAMCLIMLSRGVINWAEFNSVLESSENNSVIFEAKSVHQSEKLVSDVDETWKVKKLGVKFDSCVSYSGNSVFEKNESELGEFDSGFFSKNKKKAEFEVSIDGFHEGDKFKKPVVDDESEIKNGSEPTEVELEKGLMREVVLGQADSEILKSNSSKEAGFDVQEPELGAGFEVQDPELGENLCDEINFVASTSGIFEDFQKKREYTCKTCNKIFHSYRALGGHRANHKTISSSENRTVEANISPLTNTEANSKLDKLECNENAVEHDIGLGAMTSYELKKSKDHKCPICFKVFTSGQALGGHKRAHYIGFSENRNTESVSTKQEELPDIHNSIFDLNVPLSLESEVNDDDVVVGFKPWLKKREYTCKTCNKIFHSYRALGGHRANHKTISSSENRTVEANISPLTNTEANSKLDKLECNENAVEHDIGLGAMTSYELKKSKDHKCPICFKVFTSGQALGGHKRAHYIGFSENRNTESVSTKQEELPDIHNSIFDLNVPLSLESEVNDDDVVVGRGLLGIVEGESTDSSLNLVSFKIDTWMGLT
ncbi:hypothetical protein TEA_012864 [Camellia sinensis var. sinensis]|uniref:C2H2-type domain-containing protein n=1 Tax=Camellia sinensis var. sinensis TaxID=542762 RepID=A0A4S4DPQ9_CAMSN|nr:hypothetical protein TEA_012864 [Camellia sinensis var. sinensis]